MKTIARRANDNDIYIDSDGQIAMVDGKDMYGQIIEASILTIENEIQLYPNLGIPYFSTALGGNSASASIWKAHVRKVVTEFDFVIGIDSFDYSINPKTKTLIYSMVVKTIDGDAVVSGNVPQNMI